MVADDGARSREWLSPTHPAVRARLLAARAALTTAADAAALAAAPVTFSGFGSAGTPYEEAMRFAAANGASVVACNCAVDRSWSGRVVVVTVTVPVELRLLGTYQLRATAAAEFQPVDLVLARR